MNNPEQDLYQQTVFKKELRAQLEGIFTLLVGKNAAYGNSALDPVNIFSDVTASQSIAVNIDNKLSRLMRGGEFPGDDTVTDLLGYLILYRMALKREKGSAE